MNRPTHRARSSSHEQLVPESSLADPPSIRIYEHGVFLGLVFLCILSSLQVLSYTEKYVLPVKVQDLVLKNRATFQIFVQVLSSIFGFLQFAPICSIINRATRLRIAKKQATLDDLRFWSLLVSRGVGWDLPLKRLLVLLVFLLLTLNPAALWAGALTPIQVYTLKAGNVTVPSFKNISYIREYRSEIGNEADLMEVRAAKGMFTYDVGMAFQGTLLNTARTATTVDGSARQHSKLDNTGLMYNGRSYGIGTSVGLLEDEIWKDSLVAGYQYQEIGYKAEVHCIYNASTEFLLYELGSHYPWLYEAKGFMPNSNHILETSTYVAPNPASLFAIGVAAGAVNGTQYLSITTGDNYHFLDTAQCSFNFTSMAFDVHVDKLTSKITVMPSHIVSEIDPTNMIAHTAVRQFELISNDQTNLYQSLVGNSFISSIANYNISQLNSSALTEENASLAGLTNSLTAMLDDILGAYAGAQLIVSNQTASADSSITVISMQVGQNLYIFMELAINIVLLLVVIAEAVRTKGWRDLGKWDYMDIRNVVVSSSKGGQEIAVNAEVAKLREERDWVDRIVGGRDEELQTRVRFERDKGALVLVPKSGSEIELISRPRPMDTENLLGYI